MGKNDKIHNHFSSVIFKNTGALVLFFYIMVSFVLEHIGIGEPVESKVDIKISLLVITIYLIVKFALDINAWRKTYIYFDDNSVVMEKNTINSKKVTISLNNIANINIDRTILSAIIGVRKVKIDTNASGTAAAPEMEVYLKREKAVQFQNAITMAMAGETPDLFNEKKVTKSSIKKCIRHCVLSGDIASAFFMGVVFTGGFGIVMNSEADKKVLAGILLILLGSVALVLIGMISFVIKSVLAYYDFTSYREGNNIFIKYGLFNKKSYKIAVDKISALKIVRPPLGIIFKQEYVEIICVGIGDEEKEKSLILLCDTHNNICDNLKELLPELYRDDIEIRTCKRAKKLYGTSLAMYVLLITTALIVAKIFVEMKYIIVVGFAALIILIYIIGSTVLKCKESGCDLREKLVVTSLGGYTRNVTIVPYEKVEHLEIEQGPLKRFAKVQSATLYIKSGSILSGIVNTPIISEEDVDRLRLGYKKTYTGKA